MSAALSHSIVIEAGLAERHYWRDLWRYRELFLVLAWRDVSVRYKQTVIGLTWVMLQPLASAAVFTVIFGKVAKLPSLEGVPYALMVFAGLLPWQLISGSANSAANSLVGNSGLISKVYFPRLIIPGAAVVTCVVDFLVALAVMAGLMAWYGYLPDARVLLLPLFMLMALLAAIGPGLWIASLNVRYRDFRQVLPFLIQFGMYLSPVAYASAVVPEQWKLLYHLNPAVAVIDGFRWCLLRGAAPLYGPGLLLACAVIAVLLYVGVRQFRKTERTFADMV
jgi:lipopolysaccharide transport system permease protein